MVTARGSEADKIRGLKLGADDYITKPLSFPELRAGRGGPAPRGDRAPRSGLAGCITASSCWTSTTIAPTCAATEIHLTPTEFRLLAHLMEHAGQLATHRQVLGAVWGAGYDRDVHLLRMTIRNLRMKLDAAAPGQAYITTEFGLGYRLAGSPPQRPERAAAG